MYTPTQRLMRSRTDRMIAGVAGGIGQYVAVDPVFLRLALVVLCFTGVGILLYPILWLVMPSESQHGAGVHQQAARPGEQHEVFVAAGSTARQARFDPMTGSPVDPEGEIPINNLNSGSTPPPTDPARRNRLLGMILIGVGAVVLVSAIPGFGHLLGTFLFPALLIGAGIMLLRRNP